MTPFLALITPLTQGAHPEHPIVIPPPGQPPSDAHPERASGLRLAAAIRTGDRGPLGVDARSGAAARRALP